MLRVGINTSGPPNILVIVVYGVTNFIGGCGSAGRKGLGGRLSPCGNKEGWTFGISAPTSRIDLSKMRRVFCKNYKCILSQCNE
jgi:hypothetical protein